MSQQFCIATNHPDASSLLTTQLQSIVHNMNPQQKPLAFICIGSANIPGDNLGPLTGTMLQRCLCPFVFGTCEKPLHALTLTKHLPILDQLEKSHCMITLDAALSMQKLSGYLSVAPGKLYPGSAFAKNLPGIGHIQITGIFDEIGTEKSASQLPAMCHLLLPALLSLQISERFLL